MRTRNEIPTSMSKKELAAAYGPGLSYEAAKRRLHRWMNRIPELMAELKATGYTPQQRKMKKKQIFLIFKYLDPP